MEDLVKIQLKGKYNSFHDLAIPFGLNLNLNDGTSHNNIGILNNEGVISNNTYIHFLNDNINEGKKSRKMKNLSNNKTKKNKK